jgi:hypothetical protein
VPAPQQGLSALAPARQMLTCAPSIVAAADPARDRLPGHPERVGHPRLPAGAEEDEAGEDEGIGIGKRDAVVTLDGANRMHTATQFVMKDHGIAGAAFGVSAQGTEPGLKATQG